MFDFVNFLRDNGTDCVFDWKLNFVKKEGFLTYNGKYVEDLIVMGNHYFKQYTHLEFNFDSERIAFGGAPVAKDPTWGFPFWKLALIIASIAIAGILAAITICVIRNKRLRAEMEEWKKSKE